MVYTGTARVPDLQVQKPSSIWSDKHLVAAILKYAIHFEESRYSISAKKKSKEMPSGITLSKPSAKEDLLLS